MVTKYTGSKKYRTEWTIEPDSIVGHGVHWFRGDYDGDPMNHCSTIEEAEREIDDAIIAEQESQIKRMKVCLENSQSILKSTRSALSQFIVFNAIDEQIEANSRLLKQLES